MDKKLVTNYLYNILYQIFVVVTPLITVPYVTRVLGPEYLGISDWTSGNVQWFVLIGQLGVSIYGNRTIAQVREDAKQRSKVFWEIFAMQCVSMLASMLAYVVFIFVGNQPQYRLYATIQLISLLSVSLDITWLFYGMEDFKKASIRNVIIKLLSIACIFAFVKSPNDLALFIVINALSGVVGQVWMWSQVKEYIGLTTIHIEGVLSHFKPNIMLFIPQIATSIYTMLDVSMLGYLNTTDQVSFYQQAQRFIKMFLFFITSIGSVMLPRITNLNAHGKTNEIMHYLSMTLRMAIFLALPMIFGICTMIDTFIGWFLDASYAIVPFLICCTSPIILFISLSNVYGTQYLLPIGKTRIYTGSVVTGAVVNATLNAILMPGYGAFGAIVASVIAEFSVTFVQWVYIRRYTTIRLGMSYCIRYLIAAMMMGIVVYTIAHHLPYNFFCNLLSIGAGIIVYGLMVVILKDDFALSMLRKVKGKVIHRG